jgi:hypothetical protein
VNVSTVVCTVWLCFCLYLRFELSYRTIVSLVITRNNCDIVLSKDLRPTLVKLKLYYSNLSFITQYIQYYFYIKLTVKTTLTDLTAHIIQKTTLQIHILLIHFNTVISDLSMFLRFLYWIVKLFRYCGIVLFLLLLVFFFSILSLDLLKNLL